jgi:integrase
VVEVLESHMGLYTGSGPDAIVFATSKGTPLSDSSRSHIFKRAAAGAGRPDLRWHDLRHTGATLAARNGANLADLKRRLGHTSSRAAEIYLHAADESDQRVADALDPVAADAWRGSELTARQ